MNNKEEAEKQDWALENAIELYHAYFEPDKKEVMERYANALRKGERRGISDFKAALIQAVEKEKENYDIADLAANHIFGKIIKLINETKPL